MIQAIGIGAFVAYGVFFNSLANEFGWSRAVVSGASSVALFSSGFLAIFAGRLNDRYGPEKIMACASVFFGAGLILMSRVHEIWQLYFYYGIIFGIGLSVIDVIALTTTARWFPHSRGVMTGFVKVGTGAGQFSLTFLAGVLIAVYGWRQAYVILGASALLILFLLAGILKRDPDSAAFRSPATGNRPVRHHGSDSTSLDVREAVGTVQMWIICTVNLLLVFTMMIVMVHIVPHAVDIGLSAIQSAGVLSTIGAVSMAGRFVSGLSIDRIGSRNVMVVCYFVLITSLVWLQMANSLWMLYLFACFYGLAHGGFYTAISPIVAETFGIAAHGALFGLVVFAGTTGGAIGPVVAGLMFDMLGSYSRIFVGITIISIVGLNLILWLKPISCRNLRPG